MSQSSSRSNESRIGCIINFVGLCFTVAALVWQIVTSRSDMVAIEGHLNNQATQIALNVQEVTFARQQLDNQATQIALSAENNRLAVHAATVEADQLGLAVAQATFTANQVGSLAEQPGTPLLTDASLAPTATAFAEEEMRLEATRQAIEERQRAIVATQTAVAQPTPLTSSICRVTAGESIPPLPSAPTNGCTLLIEWWVPPDTDNCGILITSDTPALPENAAGTWWYVGPDRPESHIREFKQKYPYCKVNDLR